jgi:hypothetical protein
MQGCVCSGANKVSLITATDFVYLVIQVANRVRDQQTRVHLAIKTLPFQLCWGGNVWESAQAMLLILAVCARSVTPLVRSVKALRLNAPIVTARTEGFFVLGSIAYHSVLREPN